MIGFPPAKWESLDFIRAACRPPPPPLPPQPPQPRAPELSGHCRNSIASARCHIECQRECQKRCQIVFDRLSDRVSAYMSDRMSRWVLLWESNVTFRIKPTRVVDDIPMSSIFFLNPHLSLGEIDRWSSSRATMAMSSLSSKMARLRCYKNW